MTRGYRKTGRTDVVLVSSANDPDEIVTENMYREEKKSWRTGGKEEQRE